MTTDINKSDIHSDDCVQCTENPWCVNSYGVSCNCSLKVDLQDPECDCCKWCYVDNDFNLGTGEEEINGVFINCEDECQGINLLSSDTHYCGKDKPFCQCQCCHAHCGSEACPDSTTQSIQDAECCPPTTTPVEVVSKTFHLYTDCWCPDFAYHVTPWSEDLEVFGDSHKYIVTIPGGVMVSGCAKYEKTADFLVPADHVAITFEDINGLADDYGFQSTDCCVPAPTTDPCPHIDGDPHVTTFFGEKYDM